MEPVLNENGSSNINLLTGKEFEKLAKNAKNSVLNHLIIQHVKITNTSLLLKVEKKFILVLKNTRTILLTKTKKGEINI